MFFAKFGIAKVHLGTDTIFNRCPACEVDKEVDILVSSCYFQVYYIPLFPTEKEVTIICCTCGLKRIDLPFSDKYVRNYNEIKQFYKHPVYLYSGTIAIALAVLLIIIAVVK